MRRKGSLAGWWFCGLLIVSAFPAGLPQGAMAAGDHGGLGRLFFTPAERAALEEMRRPTGEKPAASSVPGTVSLPREIILRGMVTREGSRRLLWFAGEERAGHRPGPEAGAIPFGPSGEGEDVLVETAVGLLPLRPGQGLNPVSGRVRELYEITEGRAAPPGDEGADERHGR